MPSDPEPPFRTKSYYVSAVAALISVLVGSAVLATWIYDVSMMQQLLPGQVSMKANTAFGFVLSGLALLVARLNHRPITLIARALLEITVLLLALLTMSQYIFGIELGIDQLLASARGDRLLTSSPGRMAPTTAVGFFLFATAMVVDQLPVRRALLVSRSIASLLFLLGLIGVLGYAYGVPALYLGIRGVTATALPTALLFMVLAVGIVWLRPRFGFPAMFAERSVVGTHSRSLLPMVVGAPVLVGAAVVFGYGTYYEGPFAIALTSLGSVVAAGIVALVSIVVLRRAETTLYIRNRALSATTNGVIITDHQEPDDPIVYVNNAFTAITGYPFDDVIGRNCRFLNRNEDNDKDTMDGIRDCIRLGRAGTFELRNRRRDGTRFWNRLSLSPIVDYGGQVTHFVGILDDFTDYREQEQQVKDALEEARTANTMRDTFVRLVSHELRTPLNAALTWVRLMEIDDKPEIHAKGIGIVAQSIESQSRLIDDLVDVSRFAASGVVLEKEHVDARRLIESTVDELRPDIELRHTVRVNYSDADYRATLDPLRVRQIVRNLVTNADKYTPSGGTIDVDLHRDETNLIFTVTDTGKGLSDEEIEQIFEPFWRAETSQPGLGVGLAIVANLVEAHKGSINVVSEGPGKGTTFIIRLPLDEPAGAPK